MSAGISSRCCTPETEIWSVADKNMVLQEENTVDAVKERHVPVIEKSKGGVLVKVGSVEHPMIDTHYIEWIEVHTDKKCTGKT